MKKLTIIAGLIIAMMLVAGPGYAGLLDGAVFYATMDDNAATSTVIADVGSNGTFYSGGSPESTDLHDATGQINGALSLDGNDYILVPDGPSLNIGTGSFTIAFWTNMDSIASNQSFISKRNVWSVTYVTGAAEGMQGNVKQSDGTIKEIKTDYDPSTVGWMHVALTGDGTNLRFFINGSELVAPIAYDGTIYSDAQDVFIGAFDHATLGKIQFLLGDMDELIIYNRALSYDSENPENSEITQLNDLGNAHQSITTIPEPISCISLLLCLGLAVRRKFLK